MWLPKALLLGLQKFVVTMHARPDREPRWKLESGITCRGCCRRAVFVARVRVMAERVEDCQPLVVEGAATEVAVGADQQEGPAAQQVDATPGRNPAVRAVGVASSS